MNATAPILDPGPQLRPPSLADHGLPRGDSTLISRAIKRQKDGATLIYSRYKGLIARIVGRVSRNGAIQDELIQEAFLNAFQNLPQLRERSRLKSWLSGVAHRKNNRPIAPMAPG